MARILIVDDEETIRKLLTNAITRKGHECIAVEDGFRAVDTYATFKPDTIVSDIKMPRMDGFQFFEELKKRNGGAENLCPIIYITGHGDKTAAIESLRIGAYDFLEKPFEMDEFFHRMESALTKRKLVQDLTEAQKKLAEKFEAKTELVRRLQHPPKTKAADPLPTIEWLGNTAVMASVKESIERLAKSSIGNEMTVMVNGPSGSGKEVVARLIHELSPRAQGPWVALNCGALPETLIESELFGHEKGAFTGAVTQKVGLCETADGGTLFLDEIGELPLHLQPRLLRALQEKCFRRVGGQTEIRVDTRIVTATNRDLKKWVAEGKFREDLFYRLNTVSISLPSLKERGDDVTRLARLLLTASANGDKDIATDFDENAVKLLLNYTWPGNIRELKSVVQRAALLTMGPKINGESMARALGQVEIIPFKRTDLSVASDTTATTTTAPTTATVATPPQATPYHQWKKTFMKDMERTYLLEQLNIFHGNVSAMSRSMKVSRPNLCRLLKKHGVVAESFRKDKLGKAA